MIIVQIGSALKDALFSHNNLGSGASLLLGRKALSSSTPRGGVSRGYRASGVRSRSRMVSPLSGSTSMDS
jgi:hypothetical protein